MLKQGTVQLVEGFFPKLQDTWSTEEKNRMLIISCVDDGNGLSLFQSVPELSEKDICISYKDQYKAAVGLLYPHIRVAIEEEYVHAKLIYLLNTASGSEEKAVSYKITFIFICDDECKNFKLAGIFTGDTKDGMWAPEDKVAEFASSINMQAYKR